MSSFNCGYRGFLCLLGVSLTLLALACVGLSSRVDATSTGTPVNKILSPLGDSVPDQAWDYVQVRPGAYMFYWLYGCLNATANRSDVPLIMWLQGGPGAGSTGYGNFLEIGPLDINLQPRQYTWANVANLLFVDNPVGTGFSYVDHPSLLTKNEDEIANDLLTMFVAFLVEYPEFVDTPFFIFSESYGGKMAASFAHLLHQEISGGKLHINFRGVAVGDSWIDPISFVNSWAPYLYTTSEINIPGQNAITEAANATSNEVALGNWKKATKEWGRTEEVVERVSAGVNFYNILARNPNTSMFVESTAVDLDGDGFVDAWERRARSRITMGLPGDIDSELAALMNGAIKQSLKIIPSNVTWGGQSDAVFGHLSEDFMQSVVDTVNDLLNAGVNVIPYSGNLDLICCTIGTLEWISELSWHGTIDFLLNTPRHPLSADGVILAFKQSHKQLHFFTVLSAGHMVPADNPQGALLMLQTVFNDLI